MSDVSELLDELQDELEDSGQTLGELLETAVEDSGSVPEVVADLFQEAQETGRSLGELFGEAGRDVLEEFDGDDLLLVDDELFLDLDEERLRLDPTDDDFLHRLDVFGVGESFGLLSSSDE